jgi:hypothetical protein
MEASFQGKTTKTVCPLYNWTDDDVWGYIRKYDLPYDKGRYDKKDDTENPDKISTCYNCVDTKLRGLDVWCPKVMGLIQNVAPSTAENMRERKELLDNLLFATVPD